MGPHSRPYEPHSSGAGTRFDQLVVHTVLCGDQPPRSDVLGAKTLDSLSEDTQVRKSEGLCTWYAEGNETQELKG